MTQRRWDDFSALSFDCYGTLIDWESGLWSALQPWLRRAGSAVSREQALAAFARHESAQEAATPDLPYRAVLERVHGRLAGEWELCADEAEARAFARSIGTWRPFPDTVPALVALARRYRLFVLSNVDEVSFAGTRAQLGVRWDGVFTAEAIGSYKPDRRNFEYLVARVAERGISADRLLHCAQSVYHDVLPAGELGLATCWIDRGAGGAGQGATPRAQRAPAPTFRFGSLGELAAAVTADEAS